MSSRSLASLCDLGLPLRRALTPSRSYRWDVKAHVSAYFKLATRVKVPERAELETSLLFGTLWERRKCPQALVPAHWEGPCLLGLWEVCAQGVRSEAAAESMWDWDGKCHDRSVVPTRSLAGDAWGSASTGDQPGAGDSAVSWLLGHTRTDVWSPFGVCNLPRSRNAWARHALPLLLPFADRLHARC